MDLAGDLHHLQASKNSPVSRKERDGARERKQKSNDKNEIKASSFGGARRDIEKPHAWLQNGVAQSVFRAHLCFPSARKCFL
jgi:hypothetical protein